MLRTFHFLVRKHRANARSVIRRGHETLRDLVSIYGVNGLQKQDRISPEAFVEDFWTLNLLGTSRTVSRRHFARWLQISIADCNYSNQLGQAVCFNSVTSYIGIN